MFTAKSEILKDYDLVEGPEALQRKLEELVSKSRQDPHAAQEHFINYQVGNDQSLLKVDTSENPFLCWHVNLWGRAATKGVKNAVANANISVLVDITGEYCRQVNEKFRKREEDFVTQVLRHISPEEGVALLSKNSREIYNMSHRAAFGLFKELAKPIVPAPAPIVSPSAEAYEHSKAKPK